MNRLVVLAIALALALAPAAWGQLYKYTDKDGKTVYTDQPPASADSKALKAPPPGPTGPAKTAAEAPKTPAKAAPSRAAPAPKKDEAPLTAEQKNEKCQAARANYSYFFDGPVTMRNTKTGEKVELDEKGIEAEKAKAKAAMDAACN
jgi:hypothetical protein